MGEKYYVSVRINSYAEKIASCMNLASKFII